MVKISLKTLKNKAKKEIEKIKDLKGLNEVFNKYLGKKGELTLILRSLGKLPKAKRIKIGKAANELKNLLRVEFDKKSQETKEKIQKETEGREWIDITVPGKRPIFGHLHPLTITRRKCEEIFQTMGFTVVEGPEIETEWYNFDALNIPKDHPARDVWDTFYLKNGLLLRTHTSPVQVHYMEKNNPPLRIIVPGSVFRHEATDSSHEFQLFQIEGLMVDKSISVANLKAIVGEFFRRFFEKDVKFRIKPDYFPFTEPSFDIGISCLVCGGKGCPACKGSGWMEVAGAGMVHPNVFKNSKLISKDWQGWAFGFGLERLTMLKYKINDIRLFRSGDLRFLQQF
ncbi:MAG: phenylalanine--tRNA ligase subunit alpha [bacterium]|nr:phenylalanine--tRNA ligase subunit alpha [bacterium]